MFFCGVATRRKRCRSSSSAAIPPRSSRNVASTAYTHFPPASASVSEPEPDSAPVPVAAPTSISLHTTQPTSKTDSETKPTPATQTHTPLHLTPPRNGYFRLHARSGSDLGCIHMIPCLRLHRCPPASLPLSWLAISAPCSTYVMSEPQGRTGAVF